MIGRTNDGRTNHGRTNDGRTNDSAPYIFCKILWLGGGFPGKKIKNEAVRKKKEKGERKKKKRKRGSDFFC